jgi:hypothetical protein
LTNIYSRQQNIGKRGGEGGTFIGVDGSMYRTEMKRREEKDRGEKVEETNKKSS